MEIEKYDKLKTLLKNNPKKFFGYVLLSLFLLFFVTYVSGFFSEKGKQHATTETEDSLDQSQRDKAVTKNKSSAQIGDIKENQNTQININSPHSTQIINKIRSIKDAFLKKESMGDRYITRITLNQTEGLWSVGTKFRINVQLSGAYEDYKFIKGLPAVQMMVITRDKKEKGVIDYSTETAPLNVPIVLEIKSKTDINVDKLHVEPYSKRK